MQRQGAGESGISASHEIYLMEPQRVMISFSSMLQPEQIPALLLGEPVMGSVNQLCSVPAKLVMSVVLCVLVQRKGPGPSQDLATALQSCFYQPTSTKKSQSYQSPSSAQGALKGMLKLAQSSADTAQVHHWQWVCSSKSNLQTTFPNSAIFST